MPSEIGRRVIGDYVTLQRGTTYKSQMLGKPGPVLLGLASIQRNGGFRTDSLQTYGGDSPDKLLVRAGELYVSLKDVTQAGDLLGAVARFPQGFGVGRLTQDTVKLEPINQEVPLEYLHWILRTPDYRAYCRGHATGTTNLGLSREDFLAYPAPEPTVRQMTLVEVLRALEDKIELNRRMNETLEAIARAIFKSWFIDFDPVRAKASGEPPESICRRLGLTPALLALFPDRLVDSALGDIPEGWTTAPLYEIATYINGGAYKAFEPNKEQRGLPIIKIAELKAGVTAQTKYSDVEMPEKYRINRGDILFSWSGNPDTSIDTFVWTSGPAWLNQHIFRVVPHSELERPFVLVLLKYLRPVFAEIARNKQTTGLGHVTVSDLTRLSCVKPPHSLLQEWKEVVGPVLERAFVTGIESQTLANTRDYLIPKLLSGELRLMVEQDAAEAAA